MIQRNEASFFLHTDHTTYGFCVTETGHLEQLYYGQRIRLPEPLKEEAVLPLRQKYSYAPGNTISYDVRHPGTALEDVMTEVSGRGKGDIGETFLELEFPDGSTTTDFIFEVAEVSQDKPEYVTLPGSYSEDGMVEHLTITLRERYHPVVLELHYYVYPECDVICRSAKVKNTGAGEVILSRFMSNELGFPTCGMTFTTFHGAWAREMCRYDVPVTAGKTVSGTTAGVSSNRSNPFTMLSMPGAGEDHGDCYGFNLIYSGNHYTAVEVNSFGKTRLVSGIHPDTFSFTLKEGEELEAPEAVMSYSHKGFQGVSMNMHRFIREHIVRGVWKRKPRPVLVNSWEANYFDISEHKLVEQAKAAREIGVELFVMDDGWFGERNDDTSSLGDWIVNQKKLPGGLSGICAKINALGLDFGLWVEPEMVNINSHLYHAHPDWTLDIPAQEHAEGRNQRILDLSRREVCDYIVDAMSAVFSSCDLRYVKWDMNRIFSDVYSRALPPSRQGEVCHRYVLGLYDVMKRLTERFPDILFESCASGGNRFDLGMLCYFPQVWSSDNTDAICRAEIQNGYSYGYPLSVMGAHVSACPNHQTLRTVPLSTRFNVAAFGLLGYECNLKEMSRETLYAMKEQISLYKKWRDVFQYGDFYRISQNHNDSVLKPGKAGTGWMVVSPDKKRAVAMVLRNFVVPNDSYFTFHAKGLEEDTLYHFYNVPEKVDIRNFGSLVNMISPVHIKQDGLIHNVIAKVYKMEGETEDYSAYGSTLMYSGIVLHQNFAGTGFDDTVRYYPDFGSRMYFIEAI